MLTALLSGERIEASSGIRSQEYYCPDAACGARVILKSGTKRIAHFAHLADSSCHLAWESLAHMMAKLDIASEYRSRGFDANVEVPVSSPLENRRADVLITSPRNPGLRYAVEIQDAAIGESELWRRTKSYTAVNVRPVWISLLRRETWATKPDVNGRTIVEKYAPRLHERWIELVAGEVWFYDHEIKHFWHGVFEDHLLWRGGTDYIDVGLGEHIQIDPYQVSSERWVDVVVGGPWKLSQIRIAANAKRPIGTLIGIDGDEPRRAEEGRRKGSP